MNRTDALSDEMKNIVDEVFEIGKKAGYEQGWSDAFDFILESMKERMNGKK